MSLKVLVEPIAALNQSFVKGLLQNKSGALEPIVGSARAPIHSKEAFPKGLLAKHIGSNGTDCGFRGAHSI